MKYKVTLCKEIIYTIEVEAEDEDSAIDIAELNCRRNTTALNFIEEIIEATDIEKIKG